MKIEIVTIVVALTLVVGVLTFSLNSYFQSVDAKDNYDKLRESLRKKAEAAAAVSDRENVDILGSNSSATVSEGADSANGTDDAGADGEDANGASVIGADGEGVNGASVIGDDGGDGVYVRGADGISVIGADGGNGANGTNGTSAGGVGVTGVDGDSNNGVGADGNDG